MPRQYVKGEREESRAYSRSVTTTGGKAIWMAGVLGITDASGRSLAGDFEAQCRATFDNLRASVEAAGGAMDDIVTMTVFITDMRYGDRFTEIRRDYFTNGYPASALIGIESLARIEGMLEIQAVAVIGDQ
jgi:enamine deaminase RidA (YjgF/YER057c/UK114 family)